MITRWLIADFHYLSIGITFFYARHLRLGSRPLVAPFFAIHIAPIWCGFPRCANFVILRTSSPLMSQTSDIFETDEKCIHTAPNMMRATDFAHHIWTFVALGLIRATLRRRAFWDAILYQRGGSPPLRPLFRYPYFTGRDGLVCPRRPPALLYPEER